MTDQQKEMHCMHTERLNYCVRKAIKTKDELDKRRNFSDEVCRAEPIVPNVQDQRIK